MLSTADWNNRYLHQSGWTRALRHYLLQRVQSGSNPRILEVGCGTGAVTNDFSTSTHGRYIGIDHSLPFLLSANARDSLTGYAGADAYRLPFSDATFDVVYCHYFLMWMEDLRAALAEMRRVTISGGSLFAFAEPDYGGRIDFPAPLSEIGQFQALALEKSGANPQMGRHLMSNFTDAGLIEVKGGIIGSEWNTTYDPQSFASEWMLIEADLADVVPPSRLQTLRSLDQAAQLKGGRVLFVPTFYATGKKP